MTTPHQDKPSRPKPAHVAGFVALVWGVLLLIAAGALVDLRLGMAVCGVACITGGLALGYERSS